MYEITGLLSLGLILFTSFLLILVEDWRLCLGLLVAQYLGVFWIIMFEWPLAMAAVKLITGLIVCAILGMAAVSLPESRRNNLVFQGLRTYILNLRHLPQTNFILGRGFMLITAILVIITGISLALELTSFFRGGMLFILQAGLILIGIGFLKISFSSDAFAVILGILMTLAGFEIIYALLDKTVLVAGLLSCANLGLALAGAYLMISPSLEGHS